LFKIAGEDYKQVLCCRPAVYFSSTNAMSLRSGMISLSPLNATR